MKTRLLSRETFLYSLALILALVLRLYSLGAAPLSDYEASFALQALQVARPDGLTPVFGTQTAGPQMAYIFLTSPLFRLFGASNFLARLWPALAGVLLVGLPALLRKRVGRGAALILAFGLALDPGLVTVSRTVGGPMLAITASLLALALWDNRKPILAGIAAGLALLCGPATLNGLLILALTWGILRLARRPLWPDQDLPDSLPSTSRPAALISAVITLFLAGSLFLRYPQGIAAWASTLPGYLVGWVTPSGIPAGRLLVALFVYQPVAVLLALIGVIAWLVQRTRRHVHSPARKLPYPVFLATLLALLLAVIYPGRQVSDLVWTLAPLWALAAWSLHTYLHDIRLNPVSLVHSGLLVMLCTLFWMTLIATRLTEPLPGVPLPILRVGVLLVVLILGGLISALIAMGWTWRVSRDGMVWGLGAVLLVYTINALWGASQLRSNMPEELWGTPPAAVQVDLFNQTLVDLSKWQTGLPDTLDIVSLVDSPSLRWALRHFPKTRFMSAPTPGQQPSVLITVRDNNTPTLAASYRGQDFLWSAWPGWSSVPPDFISWLTFRKATVQTTYIILWARSDLNPGESLLDLPLESPAIAPQQGDPPLPQEP